LMSPLFLSLGAGVQSSTLALMAMHGEITPMPDHAIFADTGDEPQAVYSWIEFLRTKLSFPIHIVRHPSNNPLSVESLKIRTSSESGRVHLRHTPPVYTLSPTMERGMTIRHCTRDFKIDIINAKIRELAGRNKPANILIGISFDEAHRMKPNNVRRFKNSWPLVDRVINRWDCLSWMKEHGYPQPPRSACIYCPFHSPHEWTRIKNKTPDEFKKAEEYEIKLQEAWRSVGMKSKPFLHRSCIPLGEVRFDNNQLDLFGNECEGLCGV